VLGCGVCQPTSQPPSIFFAYLSSTLEWSVLAAVLFAYSFVHGGGAWLGTTPLLLTWTCCLAVALRARVDPRADSLRGRLLIALLTYLRPLLRCLERYRWLARGLSAVEPISPASLTR